MTISVVITVLNEENAIGPLLSSLEEQTLKPSEIVITDAGSTDRTIEIAKTTPLSIPLRIVRLPRVNRSIGRNEGIKKAVGEIIVVTDAGCRAEKQWIKKITEPFLNKASTQAVAGFYEVVSRNRLEQIFGWFLAVEPANFNQENYLPSSRSIAFTKEVWLKVGMYPEHLNTCEDLIFARNLKNTGQMVVRRGALVKWQMPATYYDFLKTVIGYARGDVAAGYKPHLLKHFTVWFRYGIFIILPYLGLVYLGYIIWKFRKRILRVSDAVLSIMVQFIVDLGVMMGGWLGFQDLIREKVTSGYRR